jgi:hypothetical protein
MVEGVASRLQYPTIIRQHGRTCAEEYDVPETRSANSVYAAQGCGIALDIPIAGGRTHGTCSISSLADRL